MFARALVGFGLLAGIGVGCGGSEPSEGDPLPGDVPSSSSSSGSGASGSSGGGSSSGGSSGTVSSSSGGGSSSGSSSGGSSSGGAQEPAPWLVQCFYGYALSALGAEGSNPEIETACGALPYDLVRKSGTQVGWEYNTVDAAYTKLFAALDSDGDGRVDEDDAPRRVALLGHSWGGMNVADVARKLLDDARVSEGRKQVELAVAWDPYKWPAPDLLPPRNAERFVVLRQSITPSSDCSAGIPVLGPFNGLRPKCAASQGCEDYDYSLSPNESFPQYPSGSRKGNTVGHCTAFNVGFVVAAALLKGETAKFPTSVPVQAP